MRLFMHGGYLFITSQLLPKSILNRLRRWILATPESLSYGQREALSCRLVPLEDTFLIFAGSRPLELLKYADKCVAVHKAGHLRDVRNF